MIGQEHYVSQYIRLHKHTPPADSIPNNLIVRFYEKNLNTFHWQRINLPDKPSPLVIKFYEDEKNANSILDVVALPLPNDSTIWGASAIYSKEDVDTSLRIYPAEELFVIGFPYQSGVYSLYPFWKRATIASEPNINSFFYIDATTREGMSGSPVVFRNSVVNAKHGPPKMVFPYLTTLIGIYNSQNVTQEIGGVVKIDKVIEKLLRIK